MSEKLKHRLKDLQGELHRINSENPTLKKLANDVEIAMETPENVSRDLQHSLQHIADEFETHHPQLTALINQVMTSLSNLGI